MLSLLTLWYLWRVVNIRDSGKPGFHGASRALISELWKLEIYAMYSVFYSSSLYSESLASRVTKNGAVEMDLELLKLSIQYPSFGRSSEAGPASFVSSHESTGMESSG